jgi:hypothetical protein
MTEWCEPDHTCDDCDEFDERCCQNRNSDHYAHCLSGNHPACEHVVIIEYAHHVMCRIHDSGVCDCRD